MTVEKAKKKSLILHVGVILLDGLLSRVPAEEVRGLEDVLALEAKAAALGREVMPAVVALISEEAGSSGSGVVVGKDGLILTAAHVVDGADGDLARLTGRSSPIGEMVDGLCDYLSHIVLYLVLGWWLSGTGGTFSGGAAWGLMLSAPMPDQRECSSSSDELFQMNSP